MQKCEVTNKLQQMYQCIHRKAMRKTDKVILGITLLFLVFFL